MKTVASFIRVLFVLLIPVGVCQCSGNYYLVDYKEYGGCDKLEDHISYNYNDAGELKSKTRLRWGWGQENTLTLYEVKRYDTGIDTIETSYQIFVRDSTDYEQFACKVVTSYTLDGIRRSTIRYGIKDGKWLDNTHILYDDKGRMIKSNWEDKEIHYIYYDSLGRCNGSKVIIINDWPVGGYCQTDTVIFSKDGCSATRTEKTCHNMDTIHEIKNIYQYEFDKHGRITCVSYPSSFINNKTIYRYDRKGRLRRETVYQQYDSDSMTKKHEETVNRYLFGLKIFSLMYHYQENGKKWPFRFTVYKYDLRHRLLLEEKMYDDIFDKMLLGRKIWTYEKAK